MDAKQYDVVLEALSRRKFLRASSAVLAVTALGGQLCCVARSELVQRIIYIQSTLAV